MKLFEAIQQYAILKEGYYIRNKHINGLNRLGVSDGVVRIDLGNNCIYQGDLPMDGYFVVRRSDTPSPHGMSLEQAMGKARDGIVIKNALGRRLIYKNKSYFIMENGTQPMDVRYFESKSKEDRIVGAINYMEEKILARNYSDENKRVIINAIGDFRRVYDMISKEVG